MGPINSTNIASIALVQVHNIQYIPIETNFLFCIYTFLNSIKYVLFILDGNLAKQLECFNELHHYSGSWCSNCIVRSHNFCVVPMNSRHVVFSGTVHSKVFANILVSRQLLFTYKGVQIILW